MPSVEFKTKSGKKVAFKASATRKSRKSRKSRTSRTSRTSSRTSRKSRKSRKLSAYNLFVKRNIGKHLPKNATLRQAQQAMSRVAADWSEARAYRGSAKKR